MLRDFVARAEALGIDYNIIEAIDQPWKTFEGGVGPYWGLFDASRQAKFRLGPGPSATRTSKIRRARHPARACLLSLPVLT